MAAENLESHEKECFFIAPIGSDDSDERRRSDGILDFVVAPAAKELGLTAVRADHIGKPGMITTQVIAHVLESKAAVVDLTGLNPNVFYELAIRHTAQKPTALIAEEGCTLPFDIAQMRTIFLDHTDLRSANECRLRIVEHLREAIENGATDSPIGATLDIQGLQTGSAVERTIADLAETIEGLVRSQAMMSGELNEAVRRLSFPERELRELSPKIWEDIIQALMFLQDSIVSSCEKDCSRTNLIDAYDKLVRPIEYAVHSAFLDTKPPLPASKMNRVFSSGYITKRLNSLSLESDKKYVATRKRNVVGDDVETF